MPPLPHSLQHSDTNDGIKYTRGRLLESEPKGKRIYFKKVFRPRILLADRSTRLTVPFA